MKYCKYCSKIATFPPKTKWGGWCCSETFYKCDGYKAKLKKQVPWNKGKTSETDKKVEEISSKLKGRKIGFTAQNKKHSEQTKKKIASSMRGNTNGNHRGDRRSYYKDIRMDSSWEVKVAEYLDANEIGWSYGSNVLVIDESSSYRPDFLLDDGSYIEVKGYWREDNLEKFQKVKTLYPNLTIDVWDKDVLKSKGIL